MKTLQELEAELITVTSPKYRDIILADIQKVKMLEKSATGDNVATMLLALKDVLDSTKRTPVVAGGGASISKQEVETLLKDAIRTNKIKLIGNVYYIDKNLNKNMNSLFDLIKYT